MHDTAPAAAATAWFAKFAEALDRRSGEAVVELFQDDCYWRDLVAFSWNVKTFEGKADIAAMLDSTLSNVAPRDWQVKRATGTPTEVEAWFTFSTAVGSGEGICRIEGGSAAAS